MSESGPTPAMQVREQIAAASQARAISKVKEAPYVDGYIDGLGLALRILEGGPEQTRGH